jgi:hypothetical protein
MHGIRNYEVSVASIAHRSLLDVFSLGEPLPVVATRHGYPFYRPCKDYTYYAAEAC